LYCGIYRGGAHENWLPTLGGFRRERRFNRWRGIVDDLIVMRSCHVAPKLDEIVTQSGMPVASYGGGFSSVVFGENPIEGFVQITEDANPFFTQRVSKYDEHSP